jgi:hypothetical protein
MSTKKMIKVSALGLVLGGALWMAWQARGTQAPGMVVARPSTGVELRRTLDDPNASRAEWRRTLADPRVAGAYHDEFRRAAHQATRKP